MKSDKYNLKRFIGDNNKVIYFDYHIRFRREVHDYKIVQLINYDSECIDDQPANNIYAVDRNANILWNIQEILGDTPYIGSIHFLPSYEERTYLVAIDCLGYHHTIDLKQKQLLNSKYIRLGQVQGKSCIGIKQVVEYEDYLIVCEDNFCTNNSAITPRNNIYGVDKDLNILWNISEMIDEEIPFSSIRLIPSESDKPYLVATSFDVHYKFDVERKKLLTFNAYFVV
jgi:hypothetical protein